MKKFESGFKQVMWSSVFLLSAVLAGCEDDGGPSSILGSGGVSTAPTVTAVSPANNATDVAVNTKIITASFSRAMNAATLTATSFTLACPTGAAVTGVVSYLAAGNVATLTLPTAPNLPPGVICTATLNTAVKDTAGVPLTSNVVWNFTTGVTADGTVPSITSILPAPGATGTARNARVIARFSEAMDPATLTTATFTLACPVGTAITGTVAYAVNGNIAIFTPASALPASVVCTATVTTGAKDAAGNALTSDFGWTFTTGTTTDTTAPTVTATGAYGTSGSTSGAGGLPINRASTAVFSEAMDPLTLTTASFTLTGPGTAPVAGTVSYANNTATFRPTSNLAANTLYTSTITVAAKDAAGNSLASNYVWTWATAATADVAAPTVASSSPADVAVGVCINKTINATFSEAMDPLTIDTGTFTLVVTAGGAAVTGVVAYDTLTNIATFNPTANLTGTPATNYTATIKGGTSGVKDLAGNALAGDNAITFTTNASTCATAPVLGAAAPFGGFGGNATLTNDGLNTVINGDVGVNASSTTITGLRDAGGNVYTVTPNNNGLVNGLVYTLTAPPGSIAGATVTQTRSDALDAFNAISPANLPGGLDVSSLAQCPSCGGAGQGPGQLAGRTLPPGVYLSTTGTYGIGITVPTADNLTLDAGGDANAVWVFQTAAGTGTLTVGVTGPATPATPIRVLLVNGAQAKNVFWYVPGGATIGTGATMTGTLLADASITLSTTGGSPPTAVLTTLNGRAIALTAGVTMTNTVVNVPAP
ncbi:MAG: Ig-like domain-containing protein [Pseudomonadota bacterium]